MKRISYLFAFFAVYIVNAPPSDAQTTMFGGRGMLRVFSAESIQPGSFTVNSFVLTFLKEENKATGLSKDYTFNIGLTYGLSNNLELTSQIVAYQDDQEHIWGPPGDLQFGLKLRLPIATSAISTGIRGFFTIPTAKVHNVKFEPFTSDKVGWGVMGLLSFDMTHSFPLFPLKFNINIGYKDNNIKTFLSDELTDQLLLGAGFKIPIRSTIIYTEYTGEIFFNHDAIAFRNNSMRVTQGVKFLGPLSLIIDLAVDVGLSRDINDPAQIVHEYADWKIIGGLTYQISSGRFSGKQGKISKRKLKGQEERDEIRSRREKAQKDLEKMRKKLEGDSDDKP
jgi:hypothetical protein